MRLALFCIILLLLSSAPVCAADDPVQTVRDARTVLLEIVKIPEQGIPPSLLHRAHALAVIPNMIKAGFIVGGRYGRGLLLVRQPGGDWSAPVFIELVGGSLGWQIGAQESDVILVFKTEQSVAGVFQAKITLGAAAGVAAGPVGRQVEGATDLQLKAEIYSYSRSRGLFAGVSLEGASLGIDGEANEDYYQRLGITPHMILEGAGGDQPIAGKRLLIDLREMMTGFGQP
jgi:lipid-binding SYLF domain-containing protein